MMLDEAAKLIADSTHFGYDEFVTNNRALEIYDDYFQKHKLLLRVHESAHDINDVFIDWKSIGNTGMFHSEVMAILKIVKQLLETSCKKASELDEAR